MWPEMFKVDRSRDESEPKISVRKFRSRRENEANASTVSSFCNKDDLTESQTYALFEIDGVAVTRRSDVIAYESAIEIL
jgi:hypothetical protein